MNVAYQLPDSWQNSLQVGATSIIAQITSFLPRLVGAIFIVIIGLLLARIVRGIVVRTLETLRVSKIVEKTPLEHFLKNAELGQRVEDIVGGIIYWLCLFVVLYTAVFVLGLTPLSTFMDRILGYIPHIFSALIIFLFGVLLAGVVESLVKGSLRSLDTHSVRLLAKTASYVVVTIGALAAIAELGIASQFILIIFIGAVSTFALGVGLAIGLGGQHVVKQIMEDWYSRTK